ncbi:GP-PDE domain-containing protein [Mycena kentingensis (nom. inval.)]|nr:GP-PDE domain-containing protein [Mycena kentingensis (nom. inval.)]
MQRHRNCSPVCISQPCLHASFQVFALLHSGVISDLPQNAGATEAYELNLCAFWPQLSQASAKLPENTLASFEAAIADGVEGIESDVHMSRDGVVIMFHDYTLTRTTNFTGNIKDSNYYGVGGMQHARTKKEPQQPIPTLPEALALLMNPENMHVHFNIDVKPSNDTETLFTAMHTAISAFPEWETALAPRILLGLWHPKDLGPAKSILPYCKRCSISFSLWITRTYMWDDVECISLWQNALVSREGQKLLREAKATGKKVLAYTVNEPAHMIEMVRYGVDGIITDYPNRYLALRSGLEKNYETTILQSSRRYLWLNISFSWLFVTFVQRFSEFALQKLVEPFPAVVT